MHTKTWKQGLISNVCIPLPPFHSTRDTMHRSLQLPILVRKRTMNKNPAHLMFWTYRGSQIIWIPNENQLPLNTCTKIKNERTIYFCCTVKLRCTEIRFTISEVIHLLLKKKKSSLYMYVHANVLSNCAHSGIKMNGNASTLYDWGQASPRHSRALHKILSLSCSKHNHLINTLKKVPIRNNAFVM